MGRASATDERLEVQVLFQNLKASLPTLRVLLERVQSLEDPVYRFYHQSFKVYSLQIHTESIVEALRALAPSRELNPYFQEILAEGTGKTFSLDNNGNRWTVATRPIVEAFFHARFFLEMTVRYGEDLTDPPNMLPSGWAALLYFFNLR